MMPSAPTEGVNRRRLGGGGAAAACGPTARLAAWGPPRHGCDATVAADAQAPPHRRSLERRKNPPCSRALLRMLGRTSALPAMPPRGLERDLEFRLKKGRREEAGQASALWSCGGWEQRSGSTKGSQGGRLSWEDSKLLSLGSTALLGANGSLTHPRHTDPFSSPLH